MTRKRVRTGCPMNCWDTCGLLVHVEDGRAVAIEGDPEHPITRGVVCPKARYQLERVYSTARLTSPLRRAGSGWESLGWEEALDLVAEEMERTRRESGPHGLLHYYDYGSQTLLKEVEHLFFDLYGGVSVPVGSLCWAGGIQAQLYDFGDYRANDPLDLVNTSLVVVWGRNPAATNMHGMMLIKEARKRGAPLVVIDPVKTLTARQADWHLQPRAGTDGALALAMAHVILEEGLQDEQFIARHVKGYAEFRAMVRDKTPEWAARVCDLPADDIRRLARLYAGRRPAAILLGYGMQRYSNGGSTIRAIDALAALCGNVGKAGGGVNYANSAVSRAFPPFQVEGVRRRGLLRTRLAQEIAEAQDPPISLIFVSRSNPIAQLPDVSATLRAWRRVRFRVVLDMVMTDTARNADLVLPVCSWLEQRDIYKTSWHNVVLYGERAIEPVGEARPDIWVYAQLARRLGFGEQFPADEDVWAERYLSRVGGLELKPGTYQRYPGAALVAWEDGRFETPSGRIELYSERAALDGLPPLPEFSPPKYLEEEGLQLLTPLPLLSIHSQFPKRIFREGEVEALIHPDTCRRLGLQEGGRAVLENERGSLEVVVRSTESVRRDSVLVYSGGWVSDGTCVNVLTAARETDMGHSAAYYDCTCRVRPVS